MQYDRYGGYPQRKRGRRRVRGRFFLFLLVFFGLIALIIWGISSLLSGGGGVVTLGYGRLEKDSTAKAMLVRVEHSDGPASYSKLQYQATENQYVNSGDLILQSYAVGYSSSMLEELENTRRQIAAKQEQNLLAGVKDAEIERYDQVIDGTVEAIASFVGGERKGVKLVDLELGLREGLEQRREHITAKQSSSGDTDLEELYAKEKEYKEKLSQYITRYTVPEGTSGRLSYKFDGYEVFLTPENLPNLTVEMMAGLINSATVPTPPPDLRDMTVPPTYRVVTPDDWYAVLLVKENEWSFAEGAQCDISFAGFEDMTFLATVNTIKSDADQVVVVLHMTEDMGPLIGARKLDAILGGRVEGFMVPKSAIKDNGPNKGVYTEDGQTFIPVEVKAMDEHGFALIDSLEEGALTRNMRIKK